MLWNIFLVVVGLVILLLGAEGMVRGASSIAAKFKVSPLVIGLTIVSLGTSAPELVVNVLAAFSNSSDLAIGNVIGSNIANILLVLGVTSLIVPLSVKWSTAYKEIPLALLGVVLLFVMGNDKLFDGGVTDALTRTDGIALLSLQAIFLYYVYGMAKSDKLNKRQLKAESGDIGKYPTAVSMLTLVLGLVGLVTGGRLLVVGASGVAATAGLSEGLIGLTVVAVGTSLPELATSIVAALRGHADLAVGNAVGSNIFNIFFVLGTTATILPLPMSDNMSIDAGIAIAVTVMLFGFLFIGQKHRLSRLEGSISLAAYVGYIAFAVIRG